MPLFFCPQRHNDIFMTFRLLSVRVHTGLLFWSDGSGGILRMHVRKASVGL